MHEGREERGRGPSAWMLLVVGYQGTLDFGGVSENWPNNRLDRTR